MTKGSAWPWRLCTSARTCPRSTAASQWSIGVQDPECRLAREPHNMDSAPLRLVLIYVPDLLTLFDHRLGQQWLLGSNPGWQPKLLLQDMLDHADQNLLFQLSAAFEGVFQHGLPQPVLHGKRNILDNAQPLLQIVYFLRTASVFIQLECPSLYPPPNLLSKTSKVYVKNVQLWAMTADEQLMQYVRVSRWMIS